MSAYTFLSLSLRVCEGMRSPHSSWLTSSTCRVETPAKYMSIVARGAGDLVGLRVEHRVQGLLDAFADHPVQGGLQHGLVDL